MFQIIRSKVSMATETKSEKFQRIAERRVNETLKAIRLLGNLADRRNYEYTDEEAALVVSAIEKECKALRSRFQAEAQTGNQPFRLRGRT